MKGYLKFEYRNLLVSLDDCPKLSSAYFKTVVRNFLIKEKQLEVPIGKLDSKNLTGKALKLSCKIWDPMVIPPKRVLKKFIVILAEMVAFKKPWLILVYLERAVCNGKLFLLSFELIFAEYYPRGGRSAQN